MADPHRIQGPSGPPESSVPKKDRTVGPDDFKKYMVEEVKETDVDKRRNRKRREEGEDETEEEKKAIGAGPQAQTAAPLGTTEAPLQAGPGKALEITSSTGGAPTTVTPLADFKPDEIEQFAWEDEARMVLSSQAAPQAQAPQAPPPSEAEVEEAPPPPPPPPQTSSSYSGGYEYEESSGWEGFGASQQQQPQAATAAEGSTGSSTSPEVEGKKKTSEKAKAPLEETKTPPAKKGTKKKAATPKLLAKEEKKPKGKPTEFKALMEEAKPQPAEKRKKVATPKKESTPPSARPLKPAREGVAPAETLPKEGPSKAQPEEEAPLIGALPSPKKEEAGKIPSKKPEAKEEEEAIEEVSAMPMAPSAAQSEHGGESGKEGKPREEKESLALPSAQTPLPMEGIPSGIIAPTGAPILTSVSPYAELHPDILSLFERMIGVLTVMKTAGITETTLFLQEKTFDGSALKGTSITITEFDFAAGELNLEFSGSTQAIALLQQNLPSLMTALHRSGLTVKRTEFIFSRKEPAGSRGEEEKDHERGKGSR